MTKQKTGFMGMDKKERKSFFSNDLIERMIRVEQRIHSSFGKYLSYNQTDYYKSLSAAERNGFEEYMKKNKRWKFLLSILAVLPFLAVFILNMGITGDVISENLGSSGSKLLNNFAGLIAVIAVVLAVLAFIFKGFRKRRMEKHNDIVDEWLAKKRTIRARYS